MKPNQRRLFLLGCLAITALAGPRSAVNLWNGLRGPYADTPGMEVAGEVGTVHVDEQPKAR